MLEARLANDPESYSDTMLICGCHLGVLTLYIGFALVSFSALQETKQKDADACKITMSAAKETVYQQ